MQVQARYSGDAVQWSGQAQQNGMVPGGSRDNSSNAPHGIGPGKRRHFAPLKTGTTLLLCQSSVEGCTQSLCLGIAVAGSLPSKASVHVCKNHSKQTAEAGKLLIICLYFEASNIGLPALNSLL